MSREEFADRRVNQVASARRRPLLACFAIAAIAGLSIASAALMEHAVWGVFAAIGLLAATWRFFVPASLIARRTDCPSVRRDEADAASSGAEGTMHESDAGKDGSRSSQIRTDWQSVLPNAFAVDPPGPAQPTEEERPVVEALVREIVRRGMTTPAIAFLEMSRPLNYVASQTLTFFGPALSVIGDSRGHARLAEFLERRGSIDWLLDRLETVDAPSP